MLYLIVSWGCLAKKFSNTSISSRTLSSLAYEKYILFSKEDENFWYILFERKGGFMYNTIPYIRGHPRYLPIVFYVSCDHLQLQFEVV